MNHSVRGVNKSEQFLFKGGYMGTHTEICRIMEKGMESYNMKKALGLSLGNNVSHVRLHTIRMTVF